MTRQLPGGRGAKRGVDANILQRESYDERTTRLPKGGGFVFSNFPHAVCALQDVTSTADKLKLSPCPIPEREHELYEVRVSVVTAVASTAVRVAIYRYRNQTEGFKKIPDTEAYLPTTAVGQSVFILPERVKLDADAKYFICSDVSDAGVELLGSVAAGGYIISNLTLSYAAASVLPTSLLTKELTQSSTESTPAVFYLSKEASDLV